MKGEGHLALRSFMNFAAASKGSVILPPCPDIIMPTLTRPTLFCITYSRAGSSSFCTQWMQETGQESGSKSEGDQSHHIIKLLLLCWRDYRDTREGGYVSGREIVWNCASPLPMAALRSSSVSNHCPQARDLPYSCSIRNVAGAHHTHILQPMQVVSS